MDLDLTVFVNLIKKLLVVIFSKFGVFDEFKSLGFDLEPFLRDETTTIEETTV